MQEWEEVEYVGRILCLEYVAMSRDQNADRIQSVSIDNSIFREGGRVEIFGNNFNKSKFYCGRN